MAILEVPFLNLALVGHSSGGVILRNTAGYIAHTFVGADIVSAFETAGAALGAMGTSAIAIATNPYVVGGVVIAAVAIGTYCYFQGVPAPVAETLVHAGLGSPTAKGLMISLPTLAPALVLMGAAGYVSYRFYQHFKEIWTDTAMVESWLGGDIRAARIVSERSFGTKVWSTMGEAVWMTKDDLTRLPLSHAQEAIAAASRASETIAGGLSQAYIAVAKRSETVLAWAKYKFGNAGPAFLAMTRRVFGET